MIEDLKSILMHPFIHVNIFNGMHCAQHRRNSNITKNCMHNRLATSNAKCCTHGTDDMMHTDVFLTDAIIFINFGS